MKFGNLTSSPLCTSGAFHHPRGKPGPHEQSHPLTPGKTPVSVLLGLVFRVKASCVLGPRTSCLCACGVWRPGVYARIYTRACVCVCEFCRGRTPVVPGWAWRPCTGVCRTGWPWGGWVSPKRGGAWPLPGCWGKGPLPTPQRSTGPGCSWLAFGTARGPTGAAGAAALHKVILPLFPVGAEGGMVLSSPHTTLRGRGVSQWGAWKGPVL